MLPNFIIIGTCRSGTTSLLRYLNEHPDIYIVNNEVTFFEEPDYSETYYGDVSYLERLLEGSHGEKALGIKRPTYILKKESPRLIHKHIPNAKLILSLRDPVDRALSNYFLFMSQGLLKVKPINKGMLDILEGNYGKYNRTKEIIDYGFYYRQLCRYLKFFDKKQIKIVWFDQLIKNPSNVYKDLLSFLNVDPSFIPRILGKRVNEGVRSLTRNKILFMASHIAFDYNEDLTRIFKKKMAFKNFFKIFLGYSIILGDRYLLKYIFSNKKPQISSKLLKKLSEIYAEDSRKLSQLLNTNLSHWNSIKNIDKFQY